MPGNLSVLGCPTNLDIVGQGPILLAVCVIRCGLDIFSLVFLPLFFLSLWETARYRLKYCLQGMLNPKQPTNQIQRLSVMQLVKGAKPVDT